MGEQECMESDVGIDGQTSISGLDENLLGEILSRLPIQSIVAASATCRRWRSILHEGSYCRRRAAYNFRARPWFFLVGLNHFLPSKNQAFGYDPEGNKFYHFPDFSLPSFDQGSLTGTHGFLFALAGSGICKLGYISGLFNKSWKETPPLFYSRRSPIAAMFPDPHSSMLQGDIDHCIIVAGGQSRDKNLVVEVYNSKRDAWDQCAPLPPEFQFSSSSQWMHSAVFNGKFYVYEIHTGCMSWLDLRQGRWSNTVMLRPMNPIYGFLIACRKCLVLAALYRQHPCFKLWSVNTETLQCTELGCMPDELFALFEEEDDEKDPLYTCVGGGDFIYIYSDSWHKDYLSCMCDLSGKTVTWRKLPQLPSPVNRFDKVVCFSSSTMPDFCS
ncbi:hypothetical protein KP509_33G062200 [Ceratopteris richardii]|nr:hypothetical protein KP509_33G062200 [Ceratopteris richardii]